MSDDKQHSAQHKDIVKKQALEQAEVKEVLNVFRKYGVPVLAGIIVVCGIFLFFSVKKSMKNKKVAEAAELLNSSSQADLQTIVDDFASTPSGPLALIQLAQIKFNQGLYDAAERQYTRFVDEYETHELAEQARLNRILCLEAKAMHGEAQAQYAQFVDAHGDSYLAPLALMGKARCLEALGQLEEARQTYEDLLTSYPTSRWEMLANDKLTMVESKLSK